MSESLLLQMKRNTPTRLWLDSIARDEMTYALANGAVGCTCNPVIILDVLERELPLWEHELISLIHDAPEATEDELAWRFVRRASASRAKLLLPIFEGEEGKNGRLSVQTDPRFFRSASKLLAQAREFTADAPNIIVKIPATQAGIEAMEEATYEGISINATVSFTLSQALAVAQAVERGLRRREQEGKRIASLGPVCTLMIGRLDDYFAQVATQAGSDIAPELLGWCGIAVFKKAYQLYQAHGYRCRLLAAAFRSVAHCSELMGGDVVVSPPYKWLKTINESGVAVRDRISEPVAPVILEALTEKLPGFAAVYAEDGMAAVDFAAFPPSVRALDQFSDSCQALARLIRGYLLRAR